METRVLGKTGRRVGVVGQGCWQFGGDWGPVSQENATGVLHAAADAGVTFFDTADSYGDGLSERLVGQFLRERADEAIMVATKIGRRADPFVAEAFTPENLRRWIERSLSNLAMDSLDLVQLHCPPTQVFSDPTVYEAMDALVTDGHVKAYGVSVETVAEAQEAMRHPSVATIQIILNAFRQKPLEEVLPQAAANGVGIIARVPLASGLLTGQYTVDTEFALTDHRTYNRHGESFDVGETFAGIPYEVGVDAAQQFAALVSEGMSPAQLALRWVVDQPGVSVVIPGASKPEQARANAGSAELPSLTELQMAAIRQIYDEQIRDHVHGRW